VKFESRKRALVHYKSGAILCSPFGAQQGLLVKSNYLTKRKIMNARILKLISLPLLISAVALLAGCKKNEVSTPLGARPAPPSSHGGAGIVSAEKNSFDQVTAKLDKGGNFYLYLSTEQALSSLSKNIATYSNVFSQMPLAPALGSENVARIFEAIGALVKDSGVENISGVGASSIAREPGFYYSKLVVHHYEGQADGAMWSAFGKEAHPLKELDLLPEDTAFAMYADVDVPLVWKTIDSELKQLHIPEVDKALAAFPEQFKSAAGISLDDALGSLGGGYGVIFTLDESKQVTLPLGTNSMDIPDPALAIFIKVKNDAIYNRVDQLTTGNPLVAKMTQDGIKTISLTFPLPLPVSLSPTLARSGDYLLLTSSDTLLREIIAVQTGKKSGFKSTPEFKKLSQGIPSEGNNFTLVSEKFGKSFSQAMQGVAGAQAGALGGQTKIWQDMIKSNAAFSYSVSVNGSEGWEAFGNGNKSMGSAAVILPAVAVGGVLAAIAIPNFVRARNTAQANAAATTGAMARRGGTITRTPQNACIINLRLIDAAKGQWALENHKQNSDTPTEQDLTPYFGRGRGGNFPVCPAGGKYIIGTIGEKPRCSIPGHVLP
jgi:hypothetical protein